MKKLNKNWRNNLITIEKPCPHIPETEILKIMPEELKERWHQYNRGKTALALSDGSLGIYPLDFRTFIRIIS